MVTNVSEYTQRYSKTRVLVGNLKPVGLMRYIQYKLK